MTFNVNMKLTSEEAKLLETLSWKEDVRRGEHECYQSFDMIQLGNKIRDALIKGHNNNSN